MALEQELKTYDENLPHLLEKAGHFVLIQHSQVAGTYTSYEDAINAGYEKFGLSPFLVRQILNSHPVHNMGWFAAFATSMVKDSMKV